MAARAQEQRTGVELVETFLAVPMLLLLVKGIVLYQLITF